MTIFSRICLTIAITFTATLATAVAAPAKATENRYQIEILAFSHLTAEAVNSENWPAVLTDSNPPPPAITDPDYQAYLRQIQYQPVTADQYLLNQEEYTLLRQPNTQLILHLAWQQTFPDVTPQPIHLYGGHGYDEHGNAQDYNNNETLPYNQFSQWQLDGDVTLSLNRFFNLSFNLLFSEPIDQLTALDQRSYFTHYNEPLFHFRLLQQRRTRSTEINYIDYPLYGVLFVIKKVGAA